MSGNILKLTSPIPPSVNHYLGYRPVIKNGKAIGMSYCTPEAKRYKKEFSQYVTSEVRSQKWNFVPVKTQHFIVNATFYFPRIDMDANNYWKVMLDAITDTQLVWVDDNVVCERVDKIMYDSSNPRIELTIQPARYIGIFDDAEQLDRFVSQNCIGCKYFKRNCSVLRKAIEGRVQPQTDGVSCEKRKSSCESAEDNNE